MSMYVDMLCSALEAWEDSAFGRDQLLEHAIACRARMLTTGTARGSSAYEALAVELAYDRSLILLCDDVGIGTTPAAFDRPQAERTRLERRLADEIDVDLVALSRARLEHRVGISHSSACR